MPLTAKNAQAMGDLCIDCWVLSFKKSSSTGEGGKWNSLIPFGLRAGTGAKDRMKRRVSIENASISKRGSRSIENLYTLPELKADGEIEKSGAELSPVTSSSSRTSLAPPTLFKPRLAPTLGQVLSSSRAPELTGLSPKSGPSSGGTRITVRGCNLGLSQEDIASISICGCDLLSTLEYHSPAKLVVVTKDWSGSGPVVLETKSGGRGISTLNFTFQDKASGKCPVTWKILSFSFPVLLVLKRNRVTGDENGSSCNKGKCILVPIVLSLLLAGRALARKLKSPSILVPRPCRIRGAKRTMGKKMGQEQWVLQEGKVHDVVIMSKINPEFSKFSFHKCLRL